MKQKPAKKATFRFYEELNDFLPARLKKKDILYSFNGTPAVKDAIEAQNVPHTEVDLILINGEPANFSKKMSDGDRVAVYPVFETFDIGPLKNKHQDTLRKSRFILDVHLGRLARLLRMTGFDTLYRNDYEDEEIIKIATRENRIILTRDKGILKNSLVKRGYYIRSQNPEVQIKEVINRLRLQSSIRFLTRCISCNGILSIIDKRDVEHLLDTDTSKYFDKFLICNNCGHIYWEGSHYQKMHNYYKKLLSSVNKQDN